MLSLERIVKRRLELAYMCSKKKWEDQLGRNIFLYMD
jgi:hypothetical protein